MWKKIEETISTKFDGMCDSSNNCFVIVISKQFSWSRVKSKIGNKVTSRSLSRIQMLITHITLQNLTDE